MSKIATSAYTQRIIAKTFVISVTFCVTCYRWELIV